MEFYNTTLGTIGGTDSDDVIVNYVNYADVYGNAGNDQITNVARGAYTYGGTGNDVIANCTADSYGGRFYGEDNEDILVNYYSANVILDGEDGYDLVVNHASNYGIPGGYIYLRGGDGNDTLVNNGFGMATLNGGWNDDILVGSAGVDVFDVRFGNDIIVNYDSNDLIYGYGSPSDYNIQVVGNDVYLTDRWGDTVWVQGAATQQFNFYTQDDTAVWEQVIINYKQAVGITDTYSYDAAWGNENNFYGTNGADNFLVSKNDGDDFIFNAEGNDTILLHDATLSDIVSTAVNNKAIEVTFNTGEKTTVYNTDEVSPTFKLSGGESYVYNRSAGSWQQT